MGGTLMLLALRLVGRLGYRRGLERFAVGAFAELFDLLFGLAEDRAAVLHEELAALVFDERFFQGNFAALDVGEDGFELGEGFLEVFRDGLVLAGHVGVIVRGGDVYWPTLPWFAPLRCPSLPPLHPCRRHLREIPRAAKCSC